MKKLLIASALLSSVFAASALQTSIVIQPNTVTNVLANIVPTNGSFKVTQIIATAGATNASAILFDSNRGALTNLVAAYTNTISYATNYVNFYTNYYGVLTLTTNLALIDLTNNLVAAITNAAPTITSISALAGTSTVVNNGNFTFQQGIFATNNSTGAGVLTLTVTYINQ